MRRRATSLGSGAAQPGKSIPRVSKARRAAHDILSRVDQEDAYASVLLQGLDNARLPVRDAALATELVYGVLRDRMFLDHVILAYSSRPLERINEPVLIALRLALHQILRLHRIPPRAAVHEAVSIVRRARRGGGAAPAAFVNGLLRSVLREPTRIPARPRFEACADPAAALALAESHPRWMVERWIRQFGLPEAAELLSAQNRPASLAFRCASGGATPGSVAAALSAEGIDARPSRYLDDFLIAEGGALQRTRSFREGHLYIMDEASGLVARIAAGGLPERAARVLDACSAPGGKGIALAEKLGADGTLVMADIHPARLRLLRQNAIRLGIDPCVVAADMAGHDAPFVPAAKFDAVLVDAPCTGTGVIRRHPELRYRVDEAHLARVVELQARLLRRCARLVREGGSLTYSVCSLETEEGIDQVERLLSEDASLRVEDPRAWLPEAAKGLVTEKAGWPFLMTLPHRDGLDGFFAARLRKAR